MNPPKPTLEVAVVMRKRRVDGPMSRWQPWRWELAEVVAQEPHFGQQPALLRRSDDETLWLHPGFSVTLHRDDAEGYYLNATTPAPGWFVHWRMEEEPSVADEPLARPLEVSLSYHDAGRWLDAQETVEQVPASPEVVAWLLAFAQEHHVLEPKRRKRPDSFRPLQDRFGNPASVSTGKTYGGSHE